MFASFDQHLKRFVQRTDQLCIDEPQAASIRHNLLEIERKAHATGWDGPNSGPRLFQIDAHPVKATVELSWCETYTEQLNSMCDTVFNGNVGAALSELARLWGVLAGFVRTGEAPDSITGDIIRMFQDRIRNSSDLLDFGPGSDLLGNRCGKRGYRLHGLGIRTEAWGATGASPELARLAASGESIADHASAKEIRMVWYAARDGSMWTVMRGRGERPWCAQVPHGMNLGIGGDMVHALSHFVDALASTDVPIAPVIPEMPAVTHDNAYGDTDRR